MAVFDPLKVSVSNFPSDQPINIEIANIPVDVSRSVDHSKHTVPLDRVLYIDRADFREVSKLIVWPQGCFCRIEHALPFCVPLTGS